MLSRGLAPGLVDQAGDVVFGAAHPVAGRLLSGEFSEHSGRLIVPSAIAVPLSSIVC